MCSIAQIRKITRADVKEVFEIAQILVTITAIFIGGIWTYILFIQKRESVEQLNISHAIHSFRVSPDYYWIHVSVALENKGATLINLKSADIRIQQILPVHKTVAASLEQGRSPEEEIENVVAWPLLCRRKPILDVELEPNETSESNHEFFVSANIEAVKIYTYFENARKAEDKRRIGWTRTSIHIPNANSEERDAQDTQEPGTSIPRRCALDLN